MIALVLVLLMLLGLFVFRGCESKESNLSIELPSATNTEKTKIKPLVEGNLTRVIDKNIQQQALDEAEKIRIKNQIKEITNEVVAKKMKEVDRSKKDQHVVALDSGTQTKQKALDEAAKIRLERVLKEKVEAVLVEKLQENGEDIDERGILHDIDHHTFAKVYILKGIFFETSSSRLAKASSRQLDVIAKHMKENKEVSIKIQGHTDNSGKKEINQKISLRRANAVKEALVSRGIEASHIVTVGQADSQPIADNTTKSGRATNRRVDIRVLAASKTK